MQITKRDFLKKLGLGGAALATGAALGDEYVTKAASPKAAAAIPKTSGSESTSSRLTIR